MSRSVLLGYYLRTLMVSIGTFITMLFFAIPFTLPPGAEAVYFVQNPYESVVTHFRLGQNVAKVQLVYNMTDTDDTKPILKISQVIINGQDNDSELIHFHINSDGWITVDSLKHPVPYEINRVSLKVTVTDKVKKISTHTMVHIRVNPGVLENDCPYSGKNNHWHLCFGGDTGEKDHLLLTVEENLRDIDLALLRQGVRLSEQCQSTSIKYRILVNGTSRNRVNVSDVLMVYDNTSFIYLKESLNREVSDELNFAVHCTVQTANGLRSTHNRQIRLIVGDVDDNPPLFQTFQHFEKNVDRFTRFQKISAVVTDLDMARADEYEVFVKDDPLGIVKIINVREFHHKQLKNQKPVPDSPMATSIATRIALNWSTPVLANFDAYSANVIIRDSNYIRGIDSNLAEQAIYTIHIKPPKANGSDISIQRSVLRSASKFAQIYKVPDSGGEHFQVAGYGSQIFAVTWYTGIVYVDSDVALRLTRENEVKLVVNVMKGNTVQKKLHLTVEIMEPLSNMTIECGLSCSFHKSEDECKSHCGLGSPTGQCQVRKGGINTPSPLYSTCSPNPQQCPDGTCDDVEKQHPMLCPQDCTRKKVTGGFLNDKHKPAMGIKLGEGWCSCDTSGSCSCKSLPRATPIVIEPKKCNCKKEVRSDTYQPAYQPTNITGDSEEDKSDNKAVPSHPQESGCGGACKTVVIAVVSGFLCFTYAVILGYCTWRCYRQRHLKANGSKKYHPGVSMSAVHSDYVEEQNRLVPPNNPSDMTAPKSIEGHSEVLAGAWEIPRTNILFEENNQDGKFGVLVRAKLCEGFNQNVQAPVTVKIARNGSSGTHRQYLWSEFILLKSLKHANIIRLIGVCSWKDPFLLVMEYCDHGTLVNYLRNHRPDGAQIGDDHESMEEESPPRSPVSITIRDLLSFSWQIAKGMEYLDDMKLVHGDLSAKNILVSSGGVIKIFNFRPPDVLALQLATITGKNYKSFASIKWMDPNIIWSQMITTKSDVWSFAVVLWEIVTFGDSPYPGISSDRILSLLKTGYRMDKPDNCPDEMYAIMQKCWKTEPDERPSFHDLANIFDKILQEKTGYLDLEGSSDVYGTEDNATGVEEEPCLCPWVAVENSVYFQQKAARLSAPDISDQRLLCRASLENGKIRHSMCHLQDLVREDFQKDVELLEHHHSVYNVC